MLLTEHRDAFARSYRLTQRQAMEIERLLRGHLGFPVAEAGRGRGARATPQAVAVFILGFAGGNALSRAAETTTDYHEALTEGADRQFKTGAPRPEDIVVCPLTGERAFGPALRTLLANPKKAAKVERIEITRDWPEAAIVYRARKGVAESRFLDSSARFAANRGALPGAVQNLCVIGGELIQQLAQALNESKVLWDATKAPAQK